jgi:hypothetical protein
VALVVLRLILVLLFVKASTVYAIPVRPHVRQFMLCEIGLEQPHAMHQNTFFGRVIRMKVEKQPFRQLNRAERAEGPLYEFTLPTSLRHYTLTPESARQLGEVFNKLFQQQMIMWVKAQVVATQNERLAIRTFCKNYDIDPDDADLEMLRKIYRDYKDKVLREKGQGQLFFSPDRNELFSDFAQA